MEQIIKNISNQGATIYVLLVSIICQIVMVMTLYKLTTRREGLKKNDVLQKDKTIKAAKSQRMTFGIKMKRFLGQIRDFKSKLGLDFTSEDTRQDIDYLLQRNNVMSLDGKNQMEFYEYDSIITVIMIVFILISFLSMFIFNVGIGGIVLVTTMIMVTKFPLMALQTKIKLQSLALTEEFGDFYLSQHHILVGGGKNPLTKGLRLYSKIAKSKEMEEFCLSSLNLIGIYGENEAIDRIISIYKEVPSLNQLLRLEKQAAEGRANDIKVELKGIREQVLTEKKTYIQKRIIKLKAKAERTIMLVYILLFQSLVGICTIFLNDYHI